MKIEVLEIKLISDFKPLRAFASIKVNGWVIRDFRVMKSNGQKAVVNPPQLSYRDEETGDIRYKTIITFPAEDKEEIDTAILHEWRLELERANAKQP